MSKTTKQVERTDAFISEFRELIASTATAVDPASPCEAACRRGLERIGATVDAVDYVAYANLANLNLVTQGTRLSLIEAQLICVGAGPTLDFADASARLAKLTGYPLFCIKSRSNHCERRSARDRRKRTSGASAWRLLDVLPPSQRDIEAPNLLVRATFGYQSHDARLPVTKSSFFPRRPTDLIERFVSPTDLRPQPKTKFVGDENSHDPP